MPGRRHVPALLLLCSGMAMVPVTQTRTGALGNCFAACLASICEAPLPEFGLTTDPDYDRNVDRWLAARGLRYQQVMFNADLKPVGHHTVEGISPRGGMHACVGLDGEIVWDPHPQDGTGRGLRTVDRYGLLLPLGARDAVVVPSKVYVGTHADYWAGWPGSKHFPISTHGLRPTVKGQFKGPQNRRDAVYVAVTPERAAAYANLYGKPLVLEVDTSKLRKGSFKADPADVPENGQARQLAYNGRIPANALRPIGAKDSIVMDPDKDGDNMLKYTARDELHHIQISTKDGSVHPDPKFKRQYAQWARDRVHRALDRALDGGGVRWQGSAAPTGKYSSFERRSWPTAMYANGDPAVALYAELPYSKANADGGQAQIKINIADYSVGKTEEGRRKYGGFAWRALAQRASTLAQAKQMAEGFIARHPEYAP